MTFQPLPIPLVKGYDESTDAAAGQDNLLTATNVVFTKDGTIAGRPGRQSQLNFVVRSPSTGDPVYAAADAFANIGFTPRGMVRLRDITGEEPAMACDGRLFVKEGTARWADRGPFASARADRIVNYTPTNGRFAVAQDFGPSPNQNVSTQTRRMFQLLTPANAVDREQTPIAGGTTVVSGNGARQGTTTAVVVHEHLSNNLRFIYRAAGADTLTSVTIASDALEPADDGDSHCICCTADSSVFFVAYFSTTADTYKVLRVTNTGSVTHTFSGTRTGLQGLWLDNGTVAGGNVVLCITTNNLFKVVTLLQADVTLVTSTSNSGSFGTDNREVVVGRDTDARFWFAYREAAGVGSGNIVVGTIDVATATPTKTRTFVSNNGGVAAAGVNWFIVHQPIRIGSRTYLTLGAATGSSSTVGTWLTLDLTNNDPAGPWGMTLVARGPTQATYPHLQPSAAVITTTADGWTFPTIDWTRFDFNQTAGVTGLDARLGLNRVMLIGPRAVQFGEGTVFSGSVPYFITRGRAQELGFPFLAGVPGVGAALQPGGAIGIGLYQVAACWRWTDDAGQIHRSFPATTSITVTGGNNTITVYVTNPWLHNHDGLGVQLEIYISDVGLTTLYLQAVVSPNFTDAYTGTNFTAQPLTNTEILYTNGAVFPNVHVPADGGVAATGRRLWVATANQVWASKLRVDGLGPEFSDSAGTGGVPPLRITLPPGAGRILALEGLETRLIVFCERGVWTLQDGGPDNAGVGPDFLPPNSISDLRVAGPRSTCETDKGVVFVSPPDVNDPNRAGPWITDGLHVEYLGRAGRNAWVASAGYAPELAYSFEDQRLYITSAPAGIYGLVVYDMRVGKWATWTHPGTSDPLRTITTVKGELWTHTDAKGPAQFTGTNGADAGSNVVMGITTSHLFGNGKSGLGWSRIRSVRLLHSAVSATYGLVFTAVLDQFTTLTPGGVTVTAGSPGSTWPTGRQAPEWRLPQQKCGSIQVSITGSPAIAEWAALELMVEPIPGVTPANLRF